MTTRDTYRRFAALIAAGLAASVACSASARAGSDSLVPGSQAHVQSLLDQYAPGVDLGRMNLPAGAFRAGAGPAAPDTPTATLAAGASDADAARARAQSVLDQYVPGLVTLGDRGVRVAAPGAPVIDTRQTISRPAETVDATREALHRLAVNEALGALNDADYARAARWVAAVAADRPKDGEVRQLESLVLAANGRVHEAADSARVALRLSAPWDRTRLKSLLPAYDDLYAMLRAESQRNPKDGRTLFLLAYHELMIGRAEDASRTLELAAENLPDGWLTSSVRARFEDQ